MTVYLGEVVNIGDGMTNEDDQVVVSITAFAQTTGSDLHSQVSDITVFEGDFIPVKLTQILLCAS